MVVVLMTDDIRGIVLMTMMAKWLIHYYEIDDWYCDGISDDGETVTMMMTYYC